MALSPERHTGTPARSFLTRKPRMRVILPSQFQPFKFSPSEVVDLVDEADLDAHLHDDDIDDDVDDSDMHGIATMTCVPPTKQNRRVRDFQIRLQSFNFGARAAGFDDEYLDEDDEIVEVGDHSEVPRPIADSDDKPLSLEESSGSNHNVPISLKRKPRMRVIPPSRFKRFKFSLSEVDDSVDEADLDAHLHDDDDLLIGCI